MDFSTSTSLLCTSMKHPAIEYWKKLKRLLCCMNLTIDNDIIIRTYDLQEMQTYVDSSHAVHMDMGKRTGGFSIFCVGALTDKYSKQNMNSRSSNESEVIGNSEYLP